MTAPAPAAAPPERARRTTARPGARELARPCLIGALLVSSLVGVVNGVITEVFGVSSFITTLGMLLGLGGLTLIISHAAPVAMPGAEVTSKVVNVTHVVNGQKITLPEQQNHVGTFARIFGA